MIRGFILSCIVLFFISCTSTKRASNNFLAPSMALPPLPESNINIQVKVLTTPFLARAHNLIPKEITSDGWPAFLQTSCDFHYKYRFVPGNFTFNCVNNRIDVVLSGQYQVAGEKCVCSFGRQTSPWVGGGCGFGQEPMRKTDIYISSSLQFQPNYTVHAKTNAQKAVAFERCSVSMFNLDITQQVLDSIRSSTNAFCYSIDSLVNGLDFTLTTQSLGRRINKKIPLAKYGFLRLNPSAVRMSNLNKNKDTLQAVLGIYCFPELLSDSTNNFTASFLPPLQNADLRPGISLYTNARYEYPFISNLVNQLIKDSSFLIEGQKIHIRNVQLSGAANGKVEMLIDFDGDKTGVLYLTGTPQLDTLHQVIAIPDLDYSLKSHDLLTTIGKTFFNNKILQALREKASVSIQQLVEQNRPAIEQQLNKKIMEGVLSTGSLTDIRVLGLVVGKETLQAQVRAQADASIIIKNL